MEEKSPPDGPVPQLPEISPDEVHKNILRCYRLRNRLDRKMLGWILILLEKKFAPALGSPRPVYYIMKNLSVPPVTIVVAAQPARSNGIAPVPSNGSAPPVPANGASPQTPARMSCQAEGAVQALLKATRHTKEEARERVLKALRLLSSLGRAPTGDEIFNTAYYGRLVEIGGKVRRCGNSGPENGAGGETGRQIPGKTPKTPEKHKTGDST